MAGNQVGDGLTVNIAGMSKNQLYDIMSQMKTLIEQNQDQARQILIQNPLLTKALFQAQIMLGMLQPPQEIPNIQPAGAHHPQPAAPPVQPPAPPLRDQTTTPTQQNQATMPISTPPPSSIPPSNPSLPPLQPPQHARGPVNVKSQAALPPHYSTQAPPPPMPPASNPTPLQQPSHITNMPHLPLQPPLQPPLPSQPRPPSMPPFPHQNYSHMGPTPGFQHPGPPQIHHSQPMFHSSSRPPTSIGPPFSQGQPLPPNQQLSQGLYQGGGSHGGMDFNQMGNQERGSNWMPGLSESAVGPGPTPSFIPSHSQPPRPASLTADMEKALLQQVMSLTPEQINQLPPDQRNQVLQLQQMLRQ
ncbi:hypothetical protein LXL04_015053 [Taraxacum kok-saghyz]